MKVYRVNDGTLSAVLTRLHDKTVGFDIETDSKDELTAKPSVFQVYFKDEVFLFPIKVIDASLSDTSLGKLREEYKTWTICGHHLFYDMSVLYRTWGVLPKAVGDDTFILACMRQCEKKGLKDLAILADPSLARSLAHFDDIWGDTLVYSFNNKDQLRYMAYDPMLPLKVVLPYLYTAELEQAYRVELSVLIPLVVSYVKGMFVDLSTFDGAMRELAEEREKLQDRINAELGHPIRVGSTAEVRKALFEELHLPKPPVLTSKGEVSVSQEALSFLEGTPIVDDIIALKSLISVESSSKKVPELLDSNHYVHPRYQQVGFDGTSRIYTKPSINQWPMSVRSLIKPAPGKKFVHADWKAAEMYIAAYLAGQDNLLEVYNAGQDIHTWNAERVLGYVNPTKEQRDIAKACAFAATYGSEGAAIARKLHLSEDEGKFLVSKFFNSLSRIKNLRDETQAESLLTHKTHTILGRPRILTNYNDPNTVAKAARQSFNTKIQGSCADLQKLAIRKIYDLHDPRIDFKFTVFDSFLLEVDESMTNEEIEAILDKISDFSDRFPGLRLKYSYGVAYDWRSAQELA